MKCSFLAEPVILLMFYCYSLNVPFAMMNNRVQQRYQDQRHEAADR